jgi:hypothetical protein
LIWRQLRLHPVCVFMLRLTETEYRGHHGTNALESRRVRVRCDESAASMTLLFPAKAVPRGNNHDETRD